MSLARRVLMNLRSQFREELKKAAYDRAHPIFHELGIRKHSKEFNWTRDYRNKRIRALMEIADQIILREAKIKLCECISAPKKKRYTGPNKSRGEDIYNWARTTFPKGPILYSFWKGQRCIYVGKGQSHGRIASYKKSKYMYKSVANQIRISSIRGHSYSHLAEHLAYRLYEPKENINEPARGRYNKRCILCRKEEQIEKALQGLLD
jgi:hypothetical protein